MKTFFLMLAALTPSIGLWWTYIHLSHKLKQKIPPELRQNHLQFFDECQQLRAHGDKDARQQAVVMMLLTVATAGTIWAWYMLLH